PGGEEELFVFALRAVAGRADADAVGKDFRAGAAGAVVDGEGVAYAAQGEVEIVGLELREGLHRADLIVEYDAELTEGLVAVRVGGGAGHAAQQITGRRR